jgi:hypothetical protein
MQSNIGEKMKIIVPLFVCVAAAFAFAQTNIAFQDCRTGDWVKVNCDRPILALGKARLMEIGSNTVTVCTAEDRFVLNKTNVQ